VAEYTGLIDEIGMWVLDAACDQARAWQEAGLDLPVNVNVSLRQFRHPEFCERVRDSLARADLEPAVLGLEITESTAMADVTCVDPVLAELAHVGVRTAIDDFGTGYSSFTRLQQMPVQAVKIDRSLLQGVPDDPRATQLAAAAIDLLLALGLDVVAEGVETEAQHHFLVDRACQMAQGFHLGRPAPAEEMSQLLVAG
jgi:EAL domain-containing protein (putative c-di-GMP-specific phosphodiesterase class I)